MILIINSLFVEPNITFNVSDNIMAKINETFEGALKPSKTFIKNYENFDIGFTISTKKEVEYLYIQGPLIDKKEKEIYFTIWMPYEKIYLSENYIEAYLDNLYEGIILGIKKYEIDTELINTKFLELKSEILDNPDIYTYKLNSPSIEEMLDDLDIFEY